MVPKLKTLDAEPEDLSPCRRVKELTYESCLLTFFLMHVHTYTNNKCKKTKAN